MTDKLSTPQVWTPAHVAALQKARCETQAELAEAARVAPNTIYRWLAGHGHPTRPSTVRNLNGLLESLKPPERERYDDELARLDAANGAAVTEPAPLAGPPPPASEEQDVNRRDNLQLIAALAAAGLTRQALWTPARPADPIDAGLVAAREGIMSALVAAYNEGDADDLVPAAASFADGLLPLLRRVPTWELGLRMATLLVDAHGMAGVLADNAGDSLAAMHHLTLASHVASRSGDPILKARACLLEARHLHSPLIDGQGNARQAVAYLGRAKALARRHADGHTRAFLSTAFVQEAADLGDLKLCNAELDAAGRVLDAATGHDGGWFSPEGFFRSVTLYIRGMSGRLAGLEGRIDEAERAIGANVAGADDAGQRIRALCTLATVRVENGEPEGACAALGGALDNARAQSCQGKVARIHAVRLRMDPALDTLDCVRGLDERLRVA